MACGLLVQIEYDVPGSCSNNGWYQFGNAVDDVHKGGGG